MARLSNLKIVDRLPTGICHTNIHWWCGDDYGVGLSRPIKGDVLEITCGENIYRRRTEKYLSDLALLKSESESDS